LPTKLNSKIKINLSEQQRLWLTRQKQHNVFTYVVFASEDFVYVTENFELTHITVKQFKEQAIPFKIFIQVLTNFCLGETND
jgi:predicted house-cleaning NTP pyrophosphatase (Maf/HAM1 superfamily)